MKLLPVALDVRARPCLVVGGGPVGARKLASLLDCEADVTIIAPDLCDEAQVLVERCKYLQRAWRSGDCDAQVLVWACTPSREVNEAIAREAREAGAWCGISGAGEGGDLHGMAEVRRGEVCVGISTGGASPALSKHLRARIEEVIGPEYEVLLDWMSDFRSEMQSVPDQRERARRWREVLASDVLALLHAGDEERARARFEVIVRGE